MTLGPQETVGGRQSSSNLPDEVTGSGRPGRAQGHTGVSVGAGMALESEHPGGGSRRGTR